MYIVSSTADIAGLEERVRRSADRFLKALAAHDGGGIALLHKLKFEQAGWQPLTEAPLNFIEQLNMTFTCLATLRAARLLLERHPDSRGLRLNMGPRRGVDIQSIAPDYLAAEVFSSVAANNNNKLRKDAARMSTCPALHRYVFYYVPGQAEGPRPELAMAPGVSIWSIDVQI